MSFFEVLLLCFISLLLTYLLQVQSLDEVLAEIFFCPSIDNISEEVMDFELMSHTINKEMKRSHPTVISLSAIDHTVWSGVDLSARSSWSTII